VHDIDFDMKVLTVRSGKGDKDRVTTFPSSLQAPMEAHLGHVRIVYEGDIAKGYGEVYLPHALARKYPNAVRTAGVQKQVSAHTFRHSFAT